MLARAGLALMWLLHGLPLALLARVGDGFGLLLYAMAPGAGVSASSTWNAVSPN